MHDLHKLKDMLCDALEEYASRGQLTQNSLTMIDTLAHACKNVCKIMDMCGETERESGIFDGVNNDEVVRKLHEMMDEATNSRVRSEIKRLADRVSAM